MAIRNIGRNKRRSALAITSVFAAIFLIMVMHGLIGGFLGSIVKNFAKNDVGHVNVATAAYRERERFSPVTESIPDSAAAVDAIRGIPSLAGKIDIVEERVRFGVVLSSGPNSKTGLCVAGDPETERKLLMLDRNILPGGAYLNAPGEAILGAALARDLGLEVGGTLKVVTQKADYGTGFKRFKIAGLFKTGVNTLDNSTFQIGIEDARELLGMPGRAQQIIVILRDYRDSDKAAAEISRALSLGAKASEKPLSAVSWTAMGDFPRFIKMAESIYFWMYLIVAFLGAFIITNVTMMVVLERKKEIGILKSMGMPNREILGLFLLESSMLGALGSAAGALFGLAFNALFRLVGFDMTKAMASFEWPMDNVIYPTVSIAAALAVFGLGAFVATLVALPPARSAAKMNPIDAIRSV